MMMMMIPLLIGLCAYIAAVVYVPRPRSLDRRVDDCRHVNLEQVGALDARLLVSLFSNVCQRRPNDLAGVLHDKVVGLDVFCREEAPTESQASQRVC